MQLRIKKNSGKSHIISYKRDDGSETWMHADDYFVRHDLSHYAIEKQLCFKNAFMGMLNKGMNIRDFENREKRIRMTVSKEAWWAENMANLFLIEITQGHFEDFNAVSAQSFGQMTLNIPPLVLSENEIVSIRELLVKLLQSWSNLPVGETMELNFDT